MNEKEFNEFYQATFPMAKRVAYKIVKDSEKAQDIVQEAFLNHWKKKDLEIENHVAYFLTAVKNISLHHISQLKTRRNFESEYLKTCQLFEYNEFVIFTEGRPLTEIVIRLLSDTEKEVWLLSRIDGMTHEEIAKLFGLSVWTISNTIKSALKKFAPYIKTMSQGEEDTNPKKATPSQIREVERMFDQGKTILEIKRKTKIHSKYAIQKYINEFLVRNGQEPKFLTSRLTTKIKNQKYAERNAERMREKREGL